MPDQSPTFSDRIKGVAPYVAVCAAMLLVGFVVWKSAAAPKASEQEGFHLACGACGHDFVIPRTALQTYPRDPERGFKCEKCAQFAAVVATPCRVCGKYFAPAPNSSACPRCSKQGPAKAATTK